MNQVLFDKKLMDIICKTPLFSNTDREQLRRVLQQGRQCQLVWFESGQLIYGKEKFQKSLGIVCSGKALVTKTDDNGHTAFLNVLSASSIFGAAALFADTSYYVSDIYAKGKCQILFIPQEVLSRLFAEDFALCRRYIVFLTDRIQFLNRRIDSFTAQGGEIRLALFLAEQLYQQGSVDTVTLPCNNTELAQMLSIGRASLYRAFDSLTEQGIVQRNGKTIKILDLNRLRQI